MAEAWAIRRAILETMIETRYVGEYVPRSDILRLIAAVSDSPDGVVRRFKHDELTLYNHKLQQRELF